MEYGSGQDALTLIELWLKAQSEAGSWSLPVYGVGGFFRDRLLNRESNDLDLVVESPGGAESFVKSFQREFSEAVSTPHALGRQYPIWEITFKTNAEWKGRSFETAGIKVQAADTQKESFLDPRSRQRITEFGTLAQDCARRDFTVNMLYWDCLQQRIVDPSGAGIADLAKKILRTHPKVEGRKIFSDDPLRILRLFRFESQLGFAPDPATIAAAVAVADRISILSAERIRDELNKAAVSGGLAPVVRSLQAHGILDKVFPELLPMVNCAQDKVYHSEGDVFVHTLLVMEQAPRTVPLQWAALLHDAGKPHTRTVEGERIKFIGHENYSESIARQILERLVFPREWIDKILLLIRLHLRGGDATQWKSAKPARRLLRELGEHREDWFALVSADSRSSLAANGQPRLEHLALIQKFFEEASRVPISKKPVLTGEQIMKEFQLPPGKRVGELLSLSAEIEDEWAVSGVAISPESLLAELRKRCEI
jgi:poly(A) polymerase